MDKFKMEKFDPISESIPEPISEKELEPEKQLREMSKEKVEMVLKTIEEIADLKNQAMQLKVKGEYHNPHFDFIAPETINRLEAGLWQEIKTIDSKNDYNAFVLKISRQRTQLARELAEQGKTTDGNPHAVFLAFLGNKVMEVYGKLLNEGKI